MAPAPTAIFWEVDPQVDFMLPEGKLYVPGAEKLLPNIRKLVNAVRENRVFLVSHGCGHVPDDPEFQQFPAHCVRGTAGAKFVPEALAEKYFTIPNDPNFALPDNFSGYQQIVMEKQTIDVFQSNHIAQVLDRLPSTPEFFVFGVATEYCVRGAAKGLLERGRRVTVITDAIEAIDADSGEKALQELKSLGAKTATTSEALSRLG
ncbi:MAG: isochorismatase family cysteine hydrolase [Candidatus Acidiferrales bacterium]